MTLDDGIVEAALAQVKAQLGIIADTTFVVKGKIETAMLQYVDRNGTFSVESRKDKQSIDVMISFKL